MCGKGPLGQRFAEYVTMSDVRRLLEPSKTVRDSIELWDRETLKWRNNSEADCPEPRTVGVLQMRYSKGRVPCASLGGESIKLLGVGCARAPLDS